MGTHSIVVIRSSRGDIELRWTWSGQPEQFLPRLMTMIRELLQEQTLLDIRSFLEKVKFCTSSETFGNIDEDGEEIQTRDYENIYNDDGEYVGERALPPPPTIFNPSNWRHLREFFSADFIQRHGFDTPDYYYFVDFDQCIVKCCTVNRRILETVAFGSKTNDVEKMIDAF